MRWLALFPWQQEGSAAACSAGNSEIIGIVTCSHSQQNGPDDWCPVEDGEMR
jgi:hypothetical protein